MRPVHLLAAAAVLALAPLAAKAEPIVIDHVTVIEGDGPVRPDMTVVVDGERIARVVPSAVDGHPSGHHIDGRGKWLMPGLMDMHIHLAGAFDPTKPAGAPQAVDRAEGLGKLASFLYAGVTAVYDAGNVPELILPLRADERAGKILSPRIFATGNLVTYPGSHGDAIAVRIDSWPQGKAILEKYFAEQHPDIAKITLEEEGWGARPMIPLLPEDLLREIIKFDNLHGVRTTIHVSSELRAEEAIYAGTDTLAHPVIQGPVSDSFVRLMAAKRIPFATTLTIGENYGRLVDHPEFLDTPLYKASFSPAERDWMRTKQREEFNTSRKVWTGYMKVMTPVAQDNVRKVDAAGGVACLGTDQSSGASTHRELELLVQAGIKPLEVLKIATYNCGLFLGREEDFGSVREGRYADLVLLNADPTVDIDNTEKIYFVMKGGQIIDEAKLPLPGGKAPTRPGAR
ncbi:MAG TPA: amidohydrolase family protein [Caulobacteraceae bacterium]|nr:amidohydrolase family protein [Caulobacteraceae bacterium]